MGLTSSIPVLRVADYAQARAFWTGPLGFEIVEEAGDPVAGFGILRRDRAQVFLIAWDGPETPYRGWRAYFHTDDLDGVIARMNAEGVEVEAPRLTEYGMREVEITDPDGNVVCFGQDAA